jgi:hypothetical protein
MQECLQVFQAGLKQKPDDSFFQCGVAFLSTGSSPVAWLYEICDEEIKKHLGPEAKPPYSCQKGWVHNVSLAKVMVAWVLNGRQGVPQKLCRQKVVFSAAVSQPFSSTEQLFTASLPQQITSLEQNIHNAAWWILEQTLQLPPGSGPQCIQHLANKLNKATSSVTPLPAEKKKSNQVTINKETADKRTSQPVRCHDSQVAIAQELFDALQLAPGYSDYDEIDFRILVPPKNSLKMQTRERLISLLWKLCVPAFHADKVTLEHLITQTQKGTSSILDRTNRHDPTNKAWSLLNLAQAYFSQRVMSSCMFRKGEPNNAFRSLCQAVYHVNPTTGKRRMVLVIADESHYGLKRNGQVDILFNGAQYSSTSFNPTNNPNFPNPDNVLSEPNVFIVSVSATGWNCNVVPYHQVVTWKDFPANYISRESYLNDDNKNKLLVSKGFDAFVQRCAKVQWLHADISRLLPSICLMVDYALAFIVVATNSAINPTVIAGMEGESNPLPTSETLQIVKHIAAESESTWSSLQPDQTDVIMIRLQPNGIQSVFASWLKAFRSLLLQSPPASQTQQQYKILCPSCAELSELPFHEWFETSLRGHRSICIVVEKARMGDTIPGLSFFDLRARYKPKGVHASSPSSFASFTQDVARAFGYRPFAPTIVLNRQGYQLFLGQTNHLDHYLQRTKAPICELPQVVGGSEVENNNSEESVLIPSALSMWHRVLFAASLRDVQAIKVLHHVQNNRILLLAHSQIGKTGSFIKLIELVLQDKYRLSEDITSLGK